MRSIGLKIFLGFWLTHALIFVVLGLLPDRGPGPDRFERDARRNASIAAAVYAQDGPKACRSFLEALNRQQGMELALFFDLHGEPVCGAPVPPAIARLVAREAVQARDITTADGDRH